MKTLTTKSDARKPGEVCCGHCGCDHKPERNSWYCWRHYDEDLGLTDPLPGLKTLLPLLAA